MKKLAFAALLVLAACAPFLPSPLRIGAPMTVVSNLQPGQLAGTWYEVASFPQQFQKGCGLISVSFTPQADGRIAVVNRCAVADPPGAVRQGTGTARLVGNGQFRVQMAGLPFISRFWVLDVSKDGRTLVLGNPNRLGGWVLRREPRVTPEILDAAREVFRRNSYDVAALQRSPLR